MSLQVDYSVIDDGYRPSHFTEADGDTKVAHYKDKISSNFISVFDNLLTVDWMDRTYRYAISRARPWGVYISTADALNLALKSEDIFKENPERAIALEATRRLVFERGAGVIGSDKDRIHGTVVWCLSSNEDNEVQYHIDYAELFRYETNVIHPPLYAGTCHVSPFADQLSDGREGLGLMEGGDFMANSGGLDHYKKFGYKCRLKPPNYIFEDLKKDSNWITVKYNHNRGILHDGDFPHLSTKVISLPKNNGANPRYSDIPVKRVILGFNCFSDIVKSCCERAPEHSDAFNRTVKLYQTLNKASNSSSSGSSGSSGGGGGVGIELQDGGKYGSSIKLDGSVFASVSKSDTVPGTASLGVKSKGVKGVTAADLKKNPALCRMLVMAAKKVRENEAQSHNVNGVSIGGCINSNSNNDSSNSNSSNSSRNTGSSNSDSNGSDINNSSTEDGKL